MTPKVVGGPPENGDGQPPRSRRVRSQGVPMWTVVSAVVVVLLLALLVVAIVLLVANG
jgi:hypothetical protein